MISFSFGIIFSSLKLFFLFVWLFFEKYFFLAGFSPEFLYSLFFDELYFFSFGIVLKILFYFINFGLILLSCLLFANYNF